MHLLARFSLSRRALTALITAAIAALGVVSLTSLRQELIPSISFPAAVVVGTYPGAAPEIVEERVTTVLEDAVEGVDGIEEITSTASSNVSTTTVLFRYGTDMPTALADMRSAVDTVASQLPEEVDPQIVAGSIDDLPVLQLAVSGAGDADALAGVVEDIVVPELEGIDGVRSVTVSGQASREIVVDVDLTALLGAGLTPDAVLAVLDDYGVRVPAGTLTDGEESLSVQVGTPIGSVADLEAIPLTSDAGTVTLGSVAEVVDGEAAATSLSRLNGEPSLSVAVTKTPDGNVVEVSEAVQQALADLGERLDAQEARVAVTFDQAPFITDSIEGLATEGLLGLGFAIVVILLFLLSLRSTVVSAVSIPLSLLTAFIVMDVVGYSLNLLTLAALTISIGRVVDDAIVVIENIKRHLSYGTEAAGRGAVILDATTEVAGAITSATIATVAVFAPIGFVGGFVGELFRPFALTVAIGMLASLFVALTIIPVLAYWFLRTPTGSDVADAAAARQAAEAKERRGLWQRGYLPLLRASLRRPAVTLLVAVAVLAGTVALVPRLQTNFLGSSGQDTLTVTQDFRPGTSLQAQGDAAAEVEQVLLGVDAVETVQTSIGSAGGATAFFGGGADQATFAITLDPDADGVAAETEIRDAVEPLAADRVTGISVAAGDTGLGSTTVDLIVAADDIDALADAGEQVAEAVRDAPGAAETTTSLAADQPVVTVTVDRDAAAAAGLTETAVAGSVAGAMSDTDIGTVDLDGDEVSVLASFGDAPADLEALEALELTGVAGPVPLGAVAEIEVVQTASAITRTDGRRTVTVSVTPADVDDLGTLTGELTERVEALDLPAGADVEVGGAAADQADAFADLGLALVLAIAIVYIVLVATFNSLAQPLILLVSIPFAATGALAGLLVTDTPLGVPALIGALMLVGVVVSNAIVLIDLINQYRAQGRDLEDAVVEGARKRLRPIVMTAAATICALLPMSLGITGGGAFISQPLAIVVIGGLLTSTLLTLVVVPVIYTVGQRRSERRRARREAAHPARPGSGEDGTGPVPARAGPSTRRGRHAKPLPATDEPPP